MVVANADIRLLDDERVQLQAHLDGMKSQVERNRLGQFATPPKLAYQILQATKELITQSDPIRFLDPAFGTGAFYAALLKTFPAESIAQATGYEVDAHYGLAAQTLWSATDLRLALQDFTQSDAPFNDCERASILICNPPYVRHHHLSAADKNRLNNVAFQTTGLQLNGLSGLYCYFLLIAHHWLAENGIACWLIPSEFMDVNYGHQVKKYLLSKVELIRIHRFDPAGTQFDDALVSSAVVWFRKRPLQDNQGHVHFSFGDSLSEPVRSTFIKLEQLSPEQKWSKFSTPSISRVHKQSEKGNFLYLSDLFEIKRGIATGANHFFILTAEQVDRLKLPKDFVKPIFPSPRYVIEDEIHADEGGLPRIEKQLFLLNCDLSEQIVRKDYPTLWQYLESGIQQKIHERYLCRHRSPWYSQDKRPPAPFLCTYMGRNERPFRFIFNHSQATAANVYLMLYPKHVLQMHFDENPSLLKKVWQLLCQIQPDQLIAEGRVYGGGLHKLEPKELSNAPIQGIQNLIPDFHLNGIKQLSLF